MLNTVKHICTNYLLAIKYYLDLDADVICESKKEIGDKFRYVLTLSSVLQ